MNLRTIEDKLRKIKMIKAEQEENKQAFFNDYKSRVQPILNSVSDCTGSKPHILTDADIQEAWQRETAGNIKYNQVVHEQIKKTFQTIHNMAS